MTWRAWQFVAVALVTAFSAAALSMAYANRTAHDSEQRWCGLLGALDDAYQSTPPSTDLGRRVAAAIHDLRADYRCD